MRVSRSIVLLSIFVLGVGADASAVTHLRHVQVTGKNQIDLLFDEKINKDQIKVEFVRDIIQLSIQDVAVYPAKILTVDDEVLKKVFAYQYLPDLVRARLTVKGEAQDFEGRIELKPQGRQLSVILKNAKHEDKLTSSSAKTQFSETEKQELLNKVLGAEKKTPVERKETKSQKLTSGKELPSPFISIGWLAVIVAFLGLVRFYLKRSSGSRSSVSRGEGRGFKFANLLTQIAPKTFNKASKMIEVVATQYIGPKQSIAVVKVKGKELVVGITNESISLISDLEGGEQKQPSFEEMIVDEDEENESQGGGAVAAGPAVYATQKERPSQQFKSAVGIRDQIKKRVEELKHL